MNTKNKTEVLIRTEDVNNLNFLSSVDDFGYTHFRGTDLDILFGFLYIFRKYSNGCFVMSNKINTNKSFDLGINWECVLQSNGSYRRTLVLPSYIKKNFEECKKRKGVRFIFILLTFADIGSCSYGNSSGDAHANLLIYDKNKKLIERFEPHGCVLKTKEWFESHEFDNTFAPIAKKIFNADYHPACIACPQTSFQTLQQREGLMTSLDPGGFCAAWTLAIIELRLKNPDETLKELQLKAIKKFQLKKKPLTSIIRNFSQFVVNKRRELTQKLPKEIQYQLEHNSDYLEVIPKQYIKKINKLIIRELKK